MFNFVKNIGPAELLIIGVLVVLFFGSKKIVELGKAAGETTKEFKKIKNDFQDVKKSVMEDTDETEAEEEV